MLSVAHFYISSPVSHGVYSAKCQSRNSTYLYHCESQDDCDTYMYLYDLRNKVESGTCHAHLKTMIWLIIYVYGLFKARAVIYDVFYLLFFF